MVLDYAGAWFVDIFLKRTLADVKPRASVYTFVLHRRRFS